MKAAAIILAKIAAWLDAPRLAREAEEDRKMAERFMLSLSEQERSNFKVRIFFE